VCRALRCLWPAGGAPLFPQRHAGSHWRATGKGRSPHMTSQFTGV